MPSERIAIQIRLKLGAKRAVDELVAFTGSSREEVVSTLIQAGLPVMYERLGIERDPAAMAGSLLDAMAGHWDDALTDEEVASIETARKVMGRIAQVRAREEKP